MSASFPKATLGIACHNAQGTVERAVNSALAQRGVECEILVVDDASEDRSRDILRAIAQKYPQRIRLVFREKNAGVAAVRNDLIREARGEFLVFFDDDDESAPDRVARQIAAIESLENREGKGVLAICHTARHILNPYGSEEGILRTLGDCERGLFPRGKEVADAILFNRPVPGGNGAMATCSQAARLLTYRAMGGFDETFRRSEDTEFCLRLARRGGVFIGISEPLVKQYRTGRIGKNLEAERKYALALFEKHTDYLAESGRGRFDFAWLDLKYFWLENKQAEFYFGLAGIFLRHPLLSLQKIVRALPNLKENKGFRAFHKRLKSS